MRRARRGTGLLRRCALIRILHTLGVISRTRISKRTAEIGATFCQRNVKDAGLDRRVLVLGRILLANIAGDGLDLFASRAVWTAQRRRVAS